MNFSGKNVLVVGASGGLGREFASVLIAGGANVYGTATSNDSAVNIPDQAVQKLLLNLESAESIATLSTYLNLMLLRKWNQEFCHDTMSINVLLISVIELKYPLLQMEKILLI
jgi:NAD(P)-dependent dehydrogenase (short-subunit alcohol dehydrogenase family)